MYESGVGHLDRWVISKGGGNIYSVSSSIVVVFSRRETIDGKVDVLVIETPRLSILWTIDCS